MSEEHIGIAAAASREIESELEKSFGAEGKGLHSRTDSVEHKLPSHLVKRIRFIASVRNKVMHEHGATIHDIDSFRQTKSDIMSELKALAAQKQREEEKRRAAMTTLNQSASPKSLHHETPTYPDSSIDFDTPDDKPDAFFERLFLIFAIGLFVIAIMLYKTVQSVDNGRDKPHPAPSYQAKNESRVDTPKQAPREASQNITPPVTKPVAKPVVKPEIKPSASVVTSVPQKPKISPDTGTVTKKTLSLGDKKEAHASKMVDAKNDLREALFKIAESKISAGNIQVIGSKNHNEIHIPINFTLAPSVIQGISKHLPEAVKSSRKGFVYFNDHDYKDKPFEQELYNWLTNTHVSLVFSAGGQKTTWDIAMGRECFVSCSKRGTDQFQILDSTKPSEGILLYKDSNPVVISNISNKALENISQITVEVRVYENYRSGTHKAFPILSITTNSQDIADNRNNNADELKEASDAINHGFVKLMESTQVKIGDVTVSGDHGTSSLHVPVSWDVNKAALSELLSPSLRYDYTGRSRRSGKYILDVDESYNTGDERLKPFSDKVFYQLREKSVKIIVKAGDYSESLTIGHAMDCFVSCSISSASGKRANDYHLMITEHDGNTLTYNDSNPIVISGIPDNVLDSIAEIEAYIVVGR